MITWTSGTTINVEITVVKGNKRSYLVVCLVLNQPLCSSQYNRHSLD